MLKALYPQDLEDTSPLPSYTTSQTSSEESSILWALRECSGNQTKAARLLGINRSTLWRKMQKYNIKI
ncbi:MAG: helix-turn-helix domain-containing protein [Enterocloster sp.]